MTVPALLGLSIRQDRDHIADRTADARLGIGEDVHDIAPLRFQGSLECCLQIVRIRDAFTIHALRSEEHTSELQSLMRISYAVFCLKNKNTSNMPKYQQL